MQIPARTSSAPPNFDSLKANKLPTPSIPKQQLQRKDDVFVYVSVVQGQVTDVPQAIPRMFQNMFPFATGQ
ncbi:unnamed protein product, partial [Lactuca virosa]